MPLYDFIYHTPVGAPTYLDILPVDVLRTALFPLLDYDARINVNIITPPGDRVAPQKIPKDRIIAHQLKTAHQFWEYGSHRAQLTTINIIRKRDARGNLLAPNILDHLFDGHKILTYTHEWHARDSLEKKAAFYLDNGGIEEYFRTPKDRDDMRVAWTKVRSFLEVHPFKLDIYPKNIVWELVTEGEQVPAHMVPADALARSRALIDAGYQPGPWVRIRTELKNN